MCLPVGAFIWGWFVRLIMVERESGKKSTTGANFSIIGTQSLREIGHTVAVAGLLDGDVDNGRQQAQKL